MHQPYYDKSELGPSRIGISYRTSDRKRDVFVSQHKYIAHNPRLWTRIRTKGIGFRPGEDSTGFLSARPKDPTRPSTLDQSLDQGYCIPLGREYTMLPKTKNYAELESGMRRIGISYVTLNHAQAGKPRDIISWWE